MNLIFFSGRGWFSWFLNWLWFFFGMPWQDRWLKRIRGANYAKRCMKKEIKERLEGLKGLRSSRSSSDYHVRCSMRLTSLDLDAQRHPWRWVDKSADTDRCVHRERWSNPLPDYATRTSPEQISAVSGNHAGLASWVILSGFAIMSMAGKKQPEMKAWFGAILG